MMELKKNVKNQWIFIIMNVYFAEFDTYLESSYGVRQMQYNFSFFFDKADIFCDRRLTLAFVAEPIPGFRDDSATAVFIFAFFASSAACFLAEATLTL